MASSCDVVVVDLVAVAVTLGHGIAINLLRQRAGLTGRTGRRGAWCRRGPSFAARLGLAGSVFHSVIRPTSGCGPLA